MTSNDVWNHVGLPWSSSPIIHNSKWGIRTPPVLTKKEPTYKNVCKTKVAQNDQQNVTSSYLNVTLRYLGPWDPWTLGLLDLFPPPTYPHTSPYILLE